MIKKIDKKDLPEEMVPFFQNWMQTFRDKFNREFVPITWTGEDKNFQALTDKGKFIEWFCFHPTVPEPHRDFGFPTRELTYLSSFMKPKVVVELGTNIGVGSFILSRLNPEAVLYTVDTKDKQVFGWETGYFSKKNNVPCNYVRGISWETKIPEKVNLCFIDADHSAEGTFNDSKWAWDNKADDFMIIWHDVHHFTPGVIEGINKFCDVYGVDVFSLNDSSMAWMYRKGEVKKTEEKIPKVSEYLKVPEKTEEPKVEVKEEKPKEEVVPPPVIKKKKSWKSTIV